MLLRWRHVAITSRLQNQKSCCKAKFHGIRFVARILVTSSPTRPTRRHPRGDPCDDVGVSRDFPVQLATRLADWSAGGLLRCSAARSSVCRVVLQIPRARHARLVADILARMKMLPWNFSLTPPKDGRAATVAGNTHRKCGEVIGDYNSTAIDFN